MILSAVEKFLPWILTAIIAAFFMYFDIERLKEITVENKKLADAIHTTNTERIIKIRERVVQLENTCIKKDIYYKDLLKVKNDTTARSTTKSGNRVTSN